MGESNVSRIAPAVEDAAFCARFSILSKFTVVSRKMDGITAMARASGSGYDPMALPDTFTVYNYANEDIRAFLHPHWHNFKAIHPMWYFFLGMLYFCIGTTAVCGNFIVLKIFSSFPALRTPANMLVMNLAFSDFCLMLALFPEMVYNFFMGGSWQFGETACQIHAFLGSVFGYSHLHSDRDFMGSLQRHRQRFLGCPSDFLQSQHDPDHQLHLVHRMGCGSSGRLRRLRTRRNPRNLLVRLRHTNLHQPDLHPAPVHHQLLGPSGHHSVGLLRNRPGCLQTRR